MSAPRSLVVLLLLLAVSHATAGGLDGSFESTGATHADGSLDLTWDLAGAFLDPAPGTRLSIALGDATLTHLNLPYEDVVVPTPGETYHVRGHTGEEQVLWTGAGTGTLHFTAADRGTLRIIPADAPTAQGRGTQASLLPAGSGWQPPHHDEPSSMEGLFVVAGVPVVPEEGHTMASSDGPLAFDGPVHLILAGGEASWNGRTLQTGMERNTEPGTDPLTDSGRRGYDDRVLVVTGRLAPLDPGEDAWTLAARGVQGTLEGSVEWRGVTGTARLDGTDLAPDPETLRANGTLALHSDLRAAPAAWDVQGDVQAVHLDRTAVLEAAGVAGAGVLLLALLLEPVRALLADLLARLLPLRLQSRDGQESRRRVLATIHQHQPVRISDLVEHTGLSRSALRHHLRILMRQGVLQSHAAAPRNHTYMLNGGSLRFQTGSRTGGEPFAADAALSVCHGHPVRRALTERLAEGPATQDDLLEHLAAAGVPVGRSTLSHHLRRMQEAHAVAAAWRDGRKSYLLDLDADVVRREQYRRYLAAHGLLDLARALSGQRAGLDRAAVAALVRDVPDAPDVERLVALAILEPHEGRFRLTAPVAALARLGGAS